MVTQWNRIAFLNVSQLSVGKDASLWRLTDPNYITQTPSGTLNNTALTLIQVLNKAVINL